MRGAEVSYHHLRSDAKSTFPGYIPHLSMEEAGCRKACFLKAADNLDAYLLPAASKNAYLLPAASKNEQRKDLCLFQWWPFHWMSSQDSDIWVMSPPMKCTWLLASSMDSTLADSYSNLLLLLYDVAFNCAVFPTSSLVWSLELFSRNYELHQIMFCLIISASLTKWVGIRILSSSKQKY